MSFLMEILLPGPERDHSSHDGAPFMNKLSIQKVSKGCNLEELMPAI